MHIFSCVAKRQIMVILFQWKLDYSIMILTKYLFSSASLYFFPKGIKCGTQIPCYSNGAVTDSSSITLNTGMNPNLILFKAHLD